MASKMSKKIGAATIAIGMATSIYLSPFLVENNQNNQNNQYDQTSAITSDYTFSAYLDELQNVKKISFNNKELYDYLYNYFNGKFSIQDLRSLTSLTIDTPLSNTDFSDLKYLTNLEELTIRDNEVNCNNLIYNQNLRSLNLSRCTATNTENLPNTITSMLLSSTDIEDDVLVLPYNLKIIDIYDTSFNKLQFKNPSLLEELYFNSYSFVDINDLTECSNLKKLTLFQCPNVLNSNLLTNMNNTNIILDEFCTLWLDSTDINNINSLSEEEKNKYTDMCNQLDFIASNITSENMTEEEKINAIILYVINQIEYDTDALAETEEGNRILTEYNKEPLYYALNYNDGVCVGYATLFTALANRVGIDSYQPDSINHTWNMIRQIGESSYSAYDLTALDNDYAELYENGTIVQDMDNPSSYYFNIGEEDRLLFYDLDLNLILSESYETNVEAKTVHDKDIEIGYLKNTAKPNNVNKPDTSKEKTKIMLKTARIELIILAVILILKAMYSGKNKKVVTRKTTKQAKQIIKYRKNS